MIEISKNREVIKDFQFHKEITFDHVFRECIYYSISHDRKEVALVKGFLPSLSIKKRCATHFRLFLGVVAFSDFIYDETTAAYKPVCPAIHESFSVSFGACIPISKACNDIVITSGLAIDGAIDVSVGIVVVVGMTSLRRKME
ncbi:MAG TPA: hypothetical protein VIK89_12205 [Cytophagaceae bacterium]